ncbi:hypothetical protein FRC04_007198 [Tulasnella sp. 424]|nr:hypothetical protein FRC04_007198 [Tulasnella sp. 424]
MDISCDLDGSIPASSIFSPPIITFTPTLWGLISPAKYIDIEFEIVFGGLGVTLETTNVDQYQCLRDMLDSLMSYSGANGAGLKTHLTLDDVEPDLENLLLFNCQPMVEELTVSGLFSYDSSPTKMVAALGTRIHDGPNSWLFPELEVIKFYLADEFYGEFEMALESRYCEARTTEGTSATTRQYPRSLKEIHFHWGNSKDSEPEVKKDFLKKICALAGNPKIFWRDVLVDFDYMSA